MTNRAMQSRVKGHKTHKGPQRNIIRVYKFKSFINCILSIGKASLYVTQENLKIITFV